MHSIGGKTSKKAVLVVPSGGALREICAAETNSFLHASSFILFATRAAFLAPYLRERACFLKLISLLQLFLSHCISSFEFEKDIQNYVLL